MCFYTGAKPALTVCVCVGGGKIGEVSRWRVSAKCAPACMGGGGVSGDMVPQKLKDFGIPILNSCNLANTSRYTWTANIDKLVSKVNRRIGLLRRIRNILSPTHLQLTL